MCVYMFSCPLLSFPNAKWTRDMFICVNSYSFLHTQVVNYALIAVTQMILMEYSSTRCLLTRG